MNSSKNFPKRFSGWRKKRTCTPRTLILITIVFVSVFLQGSQHTVFAVPEVGELNSGSAINIPADDGVVSKPGDTFTIPGEDVWDPVQLDVVSVSPVLAVPSVPTDVDTQVESELSSNDHDANSVETSADSDGDGVSDNVESADGTHPYDANSVDTDRDGLFNDIDIDDDDDGILDLVEDSGLNGGDANGDGMLDSIQRDVATVANSHSQATTTLDIVSSGIKCGVEFFEVLAEDVLDMQDNNYDYPLGLNSSIMQCVLPGDSVDIVIVYDQIYDSSEWVFKKYDVASQIYIDISKHVTVGTKSIGDEVVTTVSFKVTDGGVLDQDGRVNGAIVSLAGPSLVQTLSETGSSTALAIATGSALIAAALATTVRLPKTEEMHEHDLGLKQLMLLYYLKDFT